MDVHMLERIKTTLGVIKSEAQVPKGVRLPPFEQMGNWKNRKIVGRLSVPVLANWKENIYIYDRRVYGNVVFATQN